MIVWHSLRNLYSLLLRPLTGQFVVYPKIWAGAVILTATPNYDDRLETVYFKFLTQMLCIAAFQISKYNRPTQLYGRLSEQYQAIVNVWPTGPEVRADV